MISYERVWVVVLLVAGLAACADDAKRPSDDGEDAVQVDAAPVADAFIGGCTGDGDCRHGYTCQIAEGETTGTCVLPVVDAAADATGDAGADAASDAAADATGDAGADAASDAAVTVPCDAIISYAGGLVTLTMSEGCATPIDGLLAYDPLGEELEWDPIQQRPAPQAMLAMGPQGTVALPALLSAVVPVKNPACDPFTAGSCLWMINIVQIGPGLVRCTGNDFRGEGYDFLLAVGHEQGRDACPVVPAPASEP